MKTEERADDQVKIPESLPVLPLRDLVEDEVLLNYRIVIERQQFVYSFRKVAGPDVAGDSSFGIKPVTGNGTLLLPLSSDGNHVDMVFSCTDIETRT